MVSRASEVGRAGILDDIAEFFWPTRCSGCELPGELLCGGCEAALPRIEQRWACPRCGAPFGHLVCTECEDAAFAFAQTYSLGEFVPPLSRAIVLYKDRDERRLASVLGGLLGRGVSSVWEGVPDAVTWVPATKAAVRRRGFDHAEALARALASEAGYPGPTRLLARTHASDQRVLSRAERAANVAGTFRCVRPLDGSVLLVDDVFTTGATVDAASRALASAGAGEVRVATLARVW